MQLGVAGGVLESVATVVENVVGLGALWTEELDGVVMDAIGPLVEKVGLTGSEATCVGVDDTVLTGVADVNGEPTGNDERPWAFDITVLRAELELLTAGVTDDSEVDDAGMVPVPGAIW